MNPTLIATVFGVVLTALIAFMAWMANTLIGIKTTVIGINGNNGLNGELKQLRRDFDEHERRHGPPDRRHAYAMGDAD